jgi:hypothetical protein
MAVIKTGSERENCYRFCRILVDIGYKIARDYVENIILDHGYEDIKQFFYFYKALIIDHPKVFTVKHLDGVIRVIKKPEFDETFDMFDVGACTSIIQNIFASNSKYLKYFNNHSKEFKLFFGESHSLHKLRKLRNKHYGHMFVFKMGNKEFDEAINDMKEIFNDLLKVIKNKSYCFKTEINKVMDETIIEETMIQYSQMALKELNADRNLIKEFLKILNDKIIEDHENFETVKTLISKIDLDGLKDSLETKIINLSNEIKNNEDGFKQILKELKDLIKE